MSTATSSGGGSSLRWTKKSLRREDPVGQQLVTEGIFRYVAIDDDGRPCHIPDNPRFFTRVNGKYERQCDGGM